MTTLMTMGDLATMPTLGQRVLAGAAGLDRVVLWAHSCEMPDPWRWLGSDELLMTVGLCVPEGDFAQAEFIHHLHRAGIAGVTIGDDQMAPPITQAMLDEADRLSFPVLATSHTVPFVTVARTVSMANNAQQNEQLLLLARLYRSLTAVPAEPAESIRRMEEIFRVRTAVVDVATRVLIVPGAFEPDADSLSELTRAAAGRPWQPGAALTSASGAVRAWSLAAVRPSLLILAEEQSPMLDSFTIGHLQQAVTATVNNVIADAMARAARGEQLVSSVLAGQMPVEPLVKESRDLGLDGPAFVVLTAATDQPDDQLAVLSAAGLPFLPRRTPGRLTCCLNAADLEKGLRLLSGTTSKIGISAQIGSLRDLPEATRQAGWTLGTTAGRNGVSYYEDVRASIVPRDSASAREVSRAVLGDLLNKDERHDRLLVTLTTYLANDRRWTETAAALNIHRQTLAHRLRQIEESTGRNLRSTGDLATLWVAVSALDFLRSADVPRF